MFDTDVFVAGGGPAGLAAAIAARHKGFRVTVADSRVPPIDKPCGEGLMPDSLAALRELGIVIPAEGSYPFQGIRFVGASGCTEARFRPGCGIGVRRTTLHRELVEQAELAGVAFLWGTPVIGMQAQTIFLTTGELRARWIIGADGERSRVRAWAGLESSAPRRVRFGFRRHYSIAPWTEFMEVYWGNGLQVYVTPIAPNEVCVATISYHPHRRLAFALEQFPDLRERLQRSTISSPERGAVSATRRLSAVCRGSIALIGDASGSVDAITGQGVGLAFQQAQILADAFECGHLGSYQHGHRRIARRPQLMGELMLAMDRWPRIGARARKMLSARADLFERLLAMHTGELKPLDEMRAHTMLGWHMLVG